MRQNNLSQFLYLSFVLHIALTPTSSFVSPSPLSFTSKNTRKGKGINIFGDQSQIKSKDSSVSSTMLELSGGAEIIKAVSSSLVSGPYGVPALAGVAAVVLTPLTLYRQAYSFSVGYGYSMAAMGLAMLYSFPGLPTMATFMESKSPSFWLAASLVFYGLRLGSFILFRNFFVKSKADKFKEMDKSPKLKRIPFVLNVSLFYAFMTSPAMYALRGGIETGKLVWAGVFTAWAGAILEAVSDTHKFIVKRGKDQAKDFVGPTGGLYAISRHPNYLFELVYWYGLFLGGVPSFGKNAVAWVCSSLGIAGITFIMTSATKRLDKQQEEKYAGQEAYDSWRKKTPYPLFPLAK